MTLLLTFILKKQTYFTGSYFNSTSPSFSDFSIGRAVPSVGKEPSLSVPLGQRVGGQDMKIDFPALDFLSGDVAPGKRPAVSGGNGYSTLGRRTAAPSLSDLPRRHVELAEPRLPVPVPARCDERSAGDGAERAHNRIFTSLSFSDHGSALAGERVVVASRDRRHRTRRAERRERSVAFSAAGATCRRPGQENRFPRARLLVRRRRAAQTPRGQRRKRAVGALRVSGNEIRALSIHFREWQGKEKQGSTRQGKARGM